MTADPAPTWAAAIGVLDAGPLATLQDAGRPGYAELGVGESGAADRPAYDLANRLLGNQPGAAAIETTLGRLTIRALAAVTVVLTGAPCEAQLDGRKIGLDLPTRLSAGSMLRLGQPSRGVRSYLAVRGGIDVPLTLGSRSTDLLAGLGPAPLRAGVRLPIGIGSSCGPIAGVEVVPTASPPAEPILQIVPGPRLDRFAVGTLETLTSTPYAARPESNRIAVRLHGKPLRHKEARDWPSEGMVTGAVQVPPDGQPVVFLPDHPTTGGYSVLAVVRTCDLPVVAQLRPGDSVRFRATDRLIHPDRQ